MSLHGLTKGTPLEQLSEMMAKAEANGTMMYYALARLAKEQGLTDVSKTFIEAANQEAVHAGFYATLNAKVPQDFWMLVRGVMAAEYAGEKTVKDFADKFRAAGLAEAADEMEIFAKQEGHHGEMMEALLKKYKPEALDVAGKKIYVCGCCGYEYIGDLDAEPEDFVCVIIVNAGGHDNDESGNHRESQRPDQRAELLRAAQGVGGGVAESAGHGGGEGNEQEARRRAEGGRADRRGFLAFL